MLYYGDLSNKNDANTHPLKPGTDVVYSGFDFHDCFNSLHAKINSDSIDPLYKYHLFTLCDLINHRINRLYLKENVHLPNNDIRNTFFYREKDMERSKGVLEQISKIIQEAITNSKVEKDPVIEYCQNLINQYKEKGFAEYCYTYKL